MTATLDLSRLSEAELAELDALLEDVPGEIPLVPLSFRQWIAEADPKFQFYRHVELEIDLLQRVADGEVDRVLIMMPPRHGKSEVVSRLFPGYLLYRRPDRFVGLCSYGAALAQKLSRNARERYVRAGGVLNPEAAAVQEWETRGGGGMWASGVGGPITGKGGHALIIDDPVKNAEEAASPIVQASHQEWYDSTFRTRLEPGGAIVLCQTRWNLHDLAGYALQKAEVNGEVWHVLDLPAIAEPRASITPASAVLVEDWRIDGEALCPERYPITALHALRDTTPSYYWDALYQQRPLARDGTLFKRGWLKPVQALPRGAGITRVRWWDMAASDGKGDWTTGVRMARTSEGRFVIEDMIRVQLAPGERNQLVHRTAIADQQFGKVVTWREQEPGSAGKDAAVAFVSLLAGLPAKTKPATGAKELRAEPFAAACEIGNVDVLVAPWTEAFLTELAEFPRGRHDDQVDAAASAFTALAQAARYTVPDQRPLYY